MKVAEDCKTEVLSNFFMWCSPALERDLHFVTDLSGRESDVARYDICAL